jgi:hypothetical protein
MVKTAWQESALDRFLNSLFDLWARSYAYDYEVMSQPWIYYTFFPAVFYYVFFLIKWLTLTAPFWLPLAVLINLIGAQFSEHRRNTPDK